MNTTLRTYSAPRLTEAGSALERTLGSIETMVVEPNGSAELPFLPAN